MRHYSHVRLTVLTLLPMMLLDGCVTQPQQRVYWQDVTGANRGNTELQGDSGSCDYVRIQALNAASDRDAANSRSAGPSAGLAAMTGILRGMNESREADTAYNACMSRQGWVKRVEFISAPTQSVTQYVPPINMAHSAPSGFSSVGEACRSRCAPLGGGAAGVACFSQCPQ
jgi:hypothetical protein